MKELKRSYTEEELVKLAIKRIKIKRELYTHIAAYIFVNAFLIVVYFMGQDYYDNDTPWFIWVLAGWGLGLAFHINNAIQDLKYKFNHNAINRELDKINKSIIDNDRGE